MVQFCVNCENMLYPREIDKAIIYVLLRIVDYKDKSNDLVIFSKIYNDDTATLEDTINNKYIVNDSAITKDNKEDDVLMRNVSK